MPGKPFPAGTYVVTADDLNDLTGVYDRDATTVTVANTTTETSIYTQQITGGHMSTNRTIEFVVRGDELHNFASDLTVRVKFGGTLVWGTVVTTVGQGALGGTRRMFRLEGSISNLGSASSQWAEGTFWFTDPTAGSVGGIGDRVLDVTPIPWSSNGPLALNTNNNHSVDITVQYSVANAQLSLIKRYARLELL